LAVMCRGIKTNDGGEIVDFDVDPWKSLKGTTYRPSLLEWRSEVRRRSKINIATKRGSKLSKKDTTANITIGRTLQKLCEFGFLEALRETKVCPSTYFNVWFVCMALQEVLAKC
jgi:hypothetical protein